MTEYGSKWLDRSYMVNKVFENSKFVFVILVVINLYSSFAYACDYCGIYPNPLSTSSMDTTPLKASEITFGAAEQLIGYSKVRQDGNSVPKALHENLKINLTNLSLQYTLNPKIRFSAFVPVVFERYRTLENGVFKGAHDKGIGDVILQTEFLPVAYYHGTNSLVFKIGGGVKLPSGSTDKLSLEGTTQEAIIRGRDLSIGTGSVDFPVFTSLTFEHNKYLLEAGAQYNIRTEGDYNYQYANDLWWHVGVGLIIPQESGFTITPSFRLVGFHKDMDQQNNRDVSDSGIDLYGVEPRVVLDGILTNTKLLVAVFAPVNLDNKGLQALQDHTVTLGVEHSF